MYILHQPSGGVAQHYQIGQIIIAGAGETEHLKVILHASSAEPMLEPGGMMGMLRHDQEAMVPMAALQDPGGTVAGVAASLTAADGPFPGGTVATDEDYPFLAAKTLLLDKVKKKRDSLRSKVAPTPFGLVNIDPESRDMIQGAVSMASVLGQQFNIQFTMATDDDVELDAPEMIQLGIAVGQFVNLVQRRKRTLCEEIDGATTLEELDLIDIEAGWPSDQMPED